MTESSDADAFPTLGRVSLPPLAGAQDALWTLVLDLAELVAPARWQLVGGQMVVLHGLCAGRAPIRASRDIDMLADLLTARDGLRLCVQALADLGLAPVVDSGGRVYRFAHPDVGVSVDLLSPDHSPPRWPLRTARGRDTIQIDGGHQALQRPALIEVDKDGRVARVPVPDLLGALVLKAAAWLDDSRDRERHSADAAFLVSLVQDPLRERGRLAGSDRRRLGRLDTILGDRQAAEWTQLGEYAEDAHTAWRLLLA